LTQRTVSHRLNVTETAIQRWEKQGVPPKLSSLLAISDATGASVDFILGRSDEWTGHADWWSGPDSPTADLDAAVQQRRRGDERRRDGSRPRRP
jgi:transcriptional regulator with XRE-family HTH domain